VIRSIVVPLLAPTLVAAGIYIFLRTFSELPASLLLYSHGNEPYSVVVYQLWSGGQTEKSAAYGIVAIVFMATIVLALQRFGAGRILRG
jgi:iron(III) transport system permease protein